ncbi:hypothetical protein PRNP1_011774 [Phytophthora ramorum]
MRLSWVVLAAATLLANYAFAIQDTDRITLRGAAVFRTETGTNNRFLRAQRSVDDGGSNDNGDFDEERGRLTLQDAEKMLERMQKFGKAHPGMEKIAGLSKLSREQVKLWFVSSQRSRLFRQMYNDGMDPAILSKAIDLDDIVKKVPASKLMENGEYALFNQFSQFWLKERLSAKKVLPSAPSV